MKNHTLRPTRPRAQIQKLLLLLSAATAAVINIYPISAALVSDRFYFRNIDVHNGLSQNTVNAIIQDSHGFMWFGTKGGLSRYDGLSFRNIQDIGSNFVTSLCEDAGGTIWIGTDDGVFTYDPQNETVARFNLKIDGGSDNVTVSKIFRDDTDGVWLCMEHRGLIHCSRKTKEGEVLANHPSNEMKPSSPGGLNCARLTENGVWWLGTYDNGLWISKDKLNSIAEFTTPDGRKPFAGVTVTCILPGAYNTLYIGTSDIGLKEVDTVTGRIRDLVTTDEKGNGIFVRDLVLLPSGVLWAATESGIYICNLKTRHTVNLRSDKTPYTLSDNAAYSLFLDREEGIWIGTYFGGINYYTPQNAVFEKFYPGGEGTIEGKRIREITSGGEEALWIGTEDKGIYRFDPQTGKAQALVNPNIHNNVHGLLQDDHYLWVGTFSRGVECIDLRTKAVRKYRKSDGSGLLSDYVFKIRKTSTGDLLFGTTSGLQRYESSTDSFSSLLEGAFIYDIQESSDGQIWLATYNHGVFCGDEFLKNWVNYKHDEKTPGSLPHNKVTSVFEDSRRRMWFTMHGKGFCQFDPTTKTFIPCDTLLGPTNTIAYQIQEDKKGNFWISTNNGLIQFDPQSNRIRAYTDDDGLTSPQFNYSSSYQDSNGTLYFGSINGFVRFNPADTTVNKYPPQGVITDLQIFNQPAQIGDKNAPLRTSITEADSVVLKWNQHSFTLRMAALSYRASKKNRIEYRLDGFDKQWIPATDRPQATYANLHHGSYTFRMRVANNDGLWNPQERRLIIIIQPPFYLTQVAYILYGILGISLLGSIYYIFRRRAARHEALRMEKFEYNKEREIYTAKINFFTHIAHEIRTPLTLIKGPLDTLLQHRNIPAEQLDEELQVMGRNTDRLLSLVNQLLDFRRTETRNFHLTFVEYSVKALLEEVYECFQLAARQKKLDFRITTPESAVMAHIDREALHKILSNLLGNAIAYAHSYISVTLTDGVDSTGQNVFRITTENDGQIVPPHLRQEIFKPFVRYSPENGISETNGTGIGLALSLSLSEFHSGTLVMDEDMSCNRFILTLPFLHEDAFRFSSDSEQLHDTPLENEEQEEITECGKPSLLIVDDNVELLAFLKRHLTHEYRVFTAGDGKEALSVLAKQNINLIVCDVMMPGMDGFEFCEALKSDINYSHIPVILLTARTNIQSKIKGLELGADAYIEKPFVTEFLLATIQNLLKSRSKLHEAFIRMPFASSNSMGLTHTDEKFLEKLNELIHDNMDNPDFNIDEMSDNLGLSRSSFYRKLKGLLSTSPNEYLRVERLKQAAVLLCEGDKQISEICYMVGFSSASYFTKCFQKQFGVLPKEFADQHRDKTGT